MYFDEQMIQAAQERYGRPTLLRLNYPTPQSHFDFIRSTQRDGRAHDVTLYLYHQDRLAVTRKPPYPEGAYRPPSGGLHLGESLEVGAKREAFEELGIELELASYLLRVRVDFVCGDDCIPWTTHVFRATLGVIPAPKRGFGPRPESSHPESPRPESDFPTLDPQDRHEIAEAIWASESDFFTAMRRGLLEMGSTGLLYRSHLHDFVWRRFGWG
jgi:8-oxo-dGTP pyrophosphatase MutT (NUDIX family)